MRENLLKKQPTWGLRRALGTGQRSATPATLTKVILVLLTMFLLPSAAWGQTVTVTKTITFDQEGDGNPVSGSDINNSTIPVSVSEEINGTTYSYNSLVNINNSGAIEQYSWSNAGAVFRVYNNATTELPDYFAIDIPGKYPQVPIKVEMKFKYVNAISDPEYPDDEYSAIIYVCDYTSGDNPDLRYKTTESNLDKTTNPLIFTAGDKPVTVKGETITGEGGTDRSGDPKSLWINISLDGNSDADTEDDQATFTITEVKITYETDSYDLSIAGVPVTGVNADNILGDNTVAFTGGALKLNGASISGGGIYTTLENLEIDLVNTNTIETGSGTTGQGTSTRNGIMSTKNGTLTFVTASGGSLEITSTASAIKGFQTINGYLETHVPYTIKSKNDNYPNQDLYRTCEIEGDSVAITWMKISDLETYPLWIGDYQVNANNKDHILGSGNTTVTFSPTSSPATLTLNNANYGPSVKGIVWSGGGNLKIQFSGNNIINTYNGGELNAGEGYCILGNSSSDLILSASDNARTLTLKPNSGDTPESYYSKAAISGFSSVSLDDSWGMYYTKNCAPASAGSLTAGEEVIIIKGTPLGLSVAGVVVTSENRTNILGNGTVSFTPATVVSDQPTTGSNTPATLTLDGATISGNIQSSISPLIVHLKGSSTINPSTTNDAPFEYTGDTSSGSPALTFESSEADDGELTLSGDITTSGSGQNITLSSGGYSYSNTFGTGESVTTFGDWIIDYPDSKKHIYYNPHYGITVGNYEVTKKNKGMVTNLSGSDIKYLPEDQALLIPSNSTFADYTIKSHREELTIYVSGDCVSKSIIFESNSNFPATSGVLIIKKDPSSTASINKLTLNNTDGVITGFSNVTIDESLNLLTPATTPTWDATVTEAVFTDETLYDLWVEGIRVTSGNKDNVKGEYIDPQNPTTPSVVFDGTSTLTLTDARIEVNGKNAIESSLDNLTVNIVGENSISCRGTNDIAFNATGSGNKITFATTSSVAVQLSIRGGQNPIIGFDTNYGNGLGLLYSSKNQEYYIVTLETPVIAKTAETEGGITVALSLPGEDTYSSNTTMYYSITYSDETVDFAEYSSAFTMAKPGTVTAYLVPLGGKSNNAVAKYYGYPAAPYTIAVGDEITPEIYPAIDVNDYIELMNSSSGDENIASFTYSDGIVKGISTGNTTLTAIYSAGDQPFTVLNPIADPQAPHEFTATFSVIVGGSLSDYFEGSNNFGTFYNTDQTTTYAVPAGMKAYVITGADPVTGTVTTAETTVLPPNTPVLLEKGTATSFTKIPATSGTAPTGSILLYTGNTDVQATEGSNLYVLYNDKFVKVTTGTKIISQKCYLKLGSSAGTRGYYDIDGSDGTTAIKDVKSGEVDGEKWADGTWHDLQGRKFTTKPTKPGLYILNGKKVVIK